MKTREGDLIFLKVKRLEDSGTAYVAMSRIVRIDVCADGITVSVDCGDGGVSSFAFPGTEKELQAVFNGNS